MKRYELYPDKGHTRAMFRPEFCYADGQLEKDLNNNDYFYMEGSAIEIAVNPRSKPKGYSCVKEGKYPCRFNGRDVTLYVTQAGSHTEGRACYEDDEVSLAYISDWLANHKLDV